MWGVTDTVSKRAARARALRLSGLRGAARLVSRSALTVKAFKAYCIGTPKNRIYGIRKFIAGRGKRSNIAHTLRGARRRGRSRARRPTCDERDRESLSRHSSGSRRSAARGESDGRRTRRARSSIVHTVHRRAARRRRARAAAGGRGEGPGAQGEAEGGGGDQHAQADRSGPRSAIRKNLTAKMTIHA